MNRDLSAIKNAPCRRTIKQNELKTRLLERIYRLYDDSKNENYELEPWQQEEADMLITQWRSIS